MKNLPDRIYLDIRGFENVDMSFSEVRQRFGIPYYVYSRSKDDVEYVRKDTFVEKACEWIKEHKEVVETEDNGIIGWIPDYFIEDFRKYLEE